MSATGYSSVSDMLNLGSLRVYCADIGSVRQGHFGWARDCGPGAAPDMRRGGKEIVERTRNTLSSALGARENFGLILRARFFLSPEIASNGSRTAIRKLLRKSRLTPTLGPKDLWSQRSIV